MKRTLKFRIQWLIGASLLIILTAAIILGGESLLRTIWNLVWVCIGLSVFAGLVIICGFFLTGLTPNGILDQIEKVRRPEGQNNED